MTRPAALRIPLLVTLAGGLVVWYWWRRGSLETEAGVNRSTEETPNGTRPMDGRSRGRDSAPPIRSTAAERAALVARIKRDYEEMLERFSAEFGAAGKSFPGGLNAYLRQLALLDREKWKDLASVLPSAELEKLQMAETHAGKLVQQWLGKTGATEDQKQAVFQLQRAFDDQFALTFDLSPPALLERERARQETQSRIRETIGDELFGAWLRGEGADYANFAAYAAHQGLPPETAMNLWRTKNDFILRRLENAARSDLALEQLNAAQAALRRQTEARVLAILGPGATLTAGSDVLGWMPRK